jgi:hypothetical protein
MIVHDFDIVRTFAPSKADAPLIIDLDAVLTRTIAAQRFQSIAGRHPQIIKPRHGIEQLQLPSRRARSLRSAALPRRRKDARCPGRQSS